ncbi:pentapeptide repeat-containing protein [Geminicoccus sp.]|uniref:pentapeptide repeat-containing protein n=1 Tax=Geminicoccus sp. TaxID=2024832 RepID=UPI0039C8A162
MDLSKADNGSPNDPRDDPSCASLLGVELREANLTAADLSGTILSEADLSGSQPR